MKPSSTKTIRIALKEAPPEIDHPVANPGRPEFTFVPTSHAKALDPETSVIEGGRGAGKSFWWNTLSNPEHKNFIEKAFPEVGLNDETIIEQGFGGLNNSDSAPNKDILAGLAQKFKPRIIWNAVVAHKLNFGEPFSNLPGGKTRWTTRVQWISENPEEFENLLSKMDRSLEKKGKTVIILFDALDRLADDWESIRPLAKGLFQVALDMRATKKIRLKLFVRPDMLKDKAILAFPDASKLLARRASLIWRRSDLYALLYQCVGNNAKGGLEFRELVDSISGNNLEWNRIAHSWRIPDRLATDDGIQERIFEQLAGKAMSASPSGIKRGKPYSWLVNHLQDGDGQVSPRSFSAAVRKAAEDTPSENILPLYFRAIHAGVQVASRIRVDEIREDYPWVDRVVSPLKGKITIPCEAGEITSIWKKEKLLVALENDLEIGSDSVKLPPQHLEDGADGVLFDLEELGLIQRLTDGRVQMPDVYRIAFGLGRRGGVKPVR